MPACCHQMMSAKKPLAATKLCTISSCPPTNVYQATSRVLPFLRMSTNQWISSNIQKPQNPVHSCYASIYPLNNVCEATSTKRCLDIHVVVKFFLMSGHAWKNLYRSQLKNELLGDYSATFLVSQAFCLWFQRLPSKVFPSDARTCWIDFFLEVNLQMQFFWDCSATFLISHAFFLWYHTTYTSMKGPHVSSNSRLSLTATEQFNVAASLGEPTITCLTCHL